MGIVEKLESNSKKCQNLRGDDFNHLSRLGFDDFFSSEIAKGSAVDITNDKELEELSMYKPISEYIQNRVIGYPKPKEEIIRTLISDQISHHQILPYLDKADAADSREEDKARKLFTKAVKDIGYISGLF